MSRTSWKPHSVFASARWSGFAETSNQAYSCADYNSYDSVSPLGQIERTDLVILSKKLMRAHEADPYQITKQSPLRDKEEFLHLWLQAGIGVEEPLPPKFGRRDRCEYRAMRRLPLKFRE